MKVNIKKLQQKYNERIKKIGKNKLRIIIELLKLRILIKQQYLA